MSRLPQPVLPQPDTGPWVLAYRTGIGTCTGAGNGPSTSLRAGPNDLAAWTATSADVDVHFSGVLFERSELTKRFGRPNDAGNPAALVLAAYQQLPDRWLSALAGHFAIVVHDRARSRLLAVRDRMGQHSLFFAEVPGLVYVARAIDDLLAQPGVSRDLNRVALAEHLVHRWPEPTETYHASVRRVPPGHLLAIDGRGLRLERYWTLATTPPAAVQQDEALDLFERALERAVGRCLEQGPAAIFLSGGLDSISVTAMAADRTRQSGAIVPHALCLGFPDPECDEEFVQRGVAEALRLTLDFLPFAQATSGRGLLMPTTEIAAMLPAPLLNIWRPAYATLGRTGRERGRTVILTGTGGDEWLCVTPYLAADLMQRGHVRSLAGLVGMMQRSYRMTRLEAVYSGGWTYGARPLLAQLADRLASRAFQARRRRRIVNGTPDWVAPDPALRASLDARAPRSLVASQPAGGSFYEQDMRTALDHGVMSIEHEETFEFGRQLGVTFAHPYCDADLVELLYRMPPELLCRGGRSKGLVRDTVARRFPALGFERQRKVRATGFYTDVLLREGPAAWAAVDRGSALGALGIVDLPRLTDTMNGLFAGRRPQDRARIWSVLNLSAWSRSRTPSRQGAS